MTRPAVFSRAAPSWRRSEGPGCPLTPPERHRSSQAGNSRPIRELRPPLLLVRRLAAPKTPDRIFASYSPLVIGSGFSKRGAPNWARPGKIRAHRPKFS
jgi:hypothetical protein